MVVVIPTIDVEGVHGTRPFAQMVLGDIGSEESWGVYRMAEMFQEFGVSATFFVDIYEHTLWGEGPVVDVCEGLLRLGQDVQLHTHPSWRDDPRDSASLRALKRDRCYLPQHQNLMAKLSEAEQVEVLEHGIAFFERWLNTKPVAHRSGGYSIAQSTVRALRKVGIFLDSSMNRATARSEVTWSANRVVESDGFLELPVSVFEYVLRLPPSALGVNAYSKLMAVDIDNCTLDELLWFVDQAQTVSFGVRESLDAQLFVDEI